MSYLWTPRLAVGVDPIDTQHQELFRRVDALALAVRAQRGVAEVLPTLGFMGEYVATHFADEERLMGALGYPAAAAHRGEHAVLLKSFVRLRGEFAKAGCDAPLARRVEAELCQWLTRHVEGTDRQLGEWVRASGLDAEARRAMEPVEG